MARRSTDGAAPGDLSRMEAGERLRAARKAAGFNGQRAFAAASGISQGMVARMELGIYSVEPHRNAIAEVLGPDWETPQDPQTEEETVPPGLQPGGHR